jgi:hypothetical protein
VDTAPNLRGAARSAARRLCSGASSRAAFRRTDSRSWPKGETELPVATNSGVAEAQNRRVEITWR